MARTRGEKGDDRREEDWQRNELSLKDILGVCQTFAENGERGPGALLCWLLSNHVTPPQSLRCLIILLYHLILIPQSSCSLLGVPDFVA